MSRFQLLLVVRTVRTVIFVVLAVAITCPLVAQEGDRGRRGDRRGDGRREWDPTKYVQEIDRDKNGYLDASELQGRMKDYVAKQGFDVSKPVSVSKIQSKYTSGIEAKADAEKKAARDASRTVRKFGSDESVMPARDFSATASAAQAQQGRLEDLYEEDVVKMVQAYMKRFDENKDGWLDDSESSRIRRMLGEDADADGNDKLGELEVAAALKKRQDSDSGDRRRDWGRRGSRGERVVEERRETPGRRAISPAVVKQPTPTASSRSSRSLEGRQSSYVDGIFSKYDKDKNGSLSKSERKDMSSSVSSRFVDSDDNGEISRSEATDSLLGNNKPSSSTSASSVSDSRSSSERSSRSSSRSSSASDVKYDLKGFQRVPIPSQARTDAETDLSRQGASGDFLDLDTNTDGQITMAEFRDGKSWTDELAEKFYDLDLNEDGVVTIAEFNDR